MFILLFLVGDNIIGGRLSQKPSDAACRPSSTFSLFKNACLMA
jgi:hypothetical protein